MVYLFRGHAETRNELSDLLFLFASSEGCRSSFANEGLLAEEFLKQRVGDFEFANWKLVRSILQAFAQELTTLLTTSAVSSLPRNLRRS